MEENTNNTIGFTETERKEMAEKMTEKLVVSVTEIAKKNARQAAFKIVKRKLKDGFKIEWRCASCRTPIKIFEGKAGIKDLEKYLEKLDKKSYIPCPKYGRRHLNSFELENKVIVFKAKANLSTEIRPVKSKENTVADQK
jgi:hypothetical protein